MRLLGFRMKVFSKKCIDDCISEAFIIGTIIASKFCFKTISNALRHSAATSVARIAPYFDSHGSHVAESSSGEFPDHFSDIPPTLQ
jgi:hypothetical protein